jgi:hypothetical protein
MSKVAQLLTNHTQILLLNKMTGQIGYMRICFFEN